MEAIAKAARLAAQQMAGVSSERKNQILRNFKEELVNRKDAILHANKLDISDAEKAVKEGHMSTSLLKRLDISGKKYDSLLTGIDDIIRLDDPVGKCQYANEVSEGLQLYRVTCPIGVLAIIFEARPDAAVQIAGLSVKSGNAVILKGGKEAARSNHAIAEALTAALEALSDVPSKAVQLVDTREEILGLLKLDQYIDLVIPRGSNQLVAFIKNNTSIPVLGHADGICSVYVHEDADLHLACDIVSDSKMNYVAACNAMETLLVHEKIAGDFLPMLVKHMEKHNVTYKADATCMPLLPPASTQAATDDDYRMEWLAPIMSVKAVPGLESAVSHINSYGSHHTDCIVAKDPKAAETFMTQVDSAGVFHNASTRFADGFRFGFGAEVGISTNRVHSRGPVGLEGLVIYKYRLYGSGHTVGDFDAKKREYVHKKIGGMPDVDNIARAHGVELSHN